MKRPAYAAWLSKPGWFAPAERDRFDDIAAASGLHATAPSAGVMVASERQGALGGIAVIGTLVRRGAVPCPPSAPGRLVPAGEDALAYLTRDCWGAYVAVGNLGAGRDRCVLRAPFGDLGCYFLEAEAHVVVASSPDLLCRFGASPPAIDWGELARFLAAVDFRSGSTCLSDVRELGGGQALHVSQAGLSMERCWSPWRWTARDSAFATPDTAAHGMRDAIAEAIEGRIAADEKSVLLLSGGLDSSVLAAALSSQSRSFACATMVGPDALGDERSYARETARRVESPLIEILRDASRVDLTRPLAARLARPTGAQFRQATLAAASRVAAEHGAGLIVDGGGGDNMFCSLQSVAPVVDHLLAEGPRAALATGVSIARLADVSLTRVLHGVARRLLAGRTRYRWPVDRSLLRPGAVEGFLPRHPWLEPPRGTLPGKAAQVALLLMATAVTETPDGEQSPMVLSPLVAQPVAEAALRVPTWMWFEDGLNRAVVRAAFRTSLPTAVIRRRSKGTPASFMSALVEARAGDLRPFLLDGLLSANGVLDRRAVEEALRPGPARDHGLARLLQVADAEAWARSWS